MPYFCRIMGDIWKKIVIGLLSYQNSSFGGMGNLLIQCYQDSNVGISTQHLLLLLIMVKRRTQQLFDTLGHPFIICQGSGMLEGMKKQLMLVYLAPSVLAPLRLSQKTWLHKLLCDDLKNLKLGDVQWAQRQVQV